MRPISLKLSGLHSYREEQEIDFEKLCEAGLFGIFGPTGSGKSTILDAITLALYGQVIRMGGGSHPQEVLNQLETRLFVSFTFELGKGGERQRYTIEREFGLDKKGKKKPPEVRVIERGMTPDAPDQVLESKATAATTLVEQLVGLTIHDFTRAVVLPQGQFSKFLTLKGSERNEMLQRIFHLHEYGEKLQERIRTLHEKNRAQLHRFEIELAGLGDAGPEALQAASVEYEATLEKEKNISDERAVLYQRKREMEQIREWQEEQTAIRKRISALQAEEAEITDLSVQISQIEASRKLWPLLEKARQLHEEWKQTEEVLARQRSERNEASGTFEVAEQIHKNRQTQLRTDEPRLIESKSELVQAVEWEKELTALAAEKEKFLIELHALGTELELITDEKKQSEQQLSVWTDELQTLDKQIQELTITAEARKKIQMALDAKKAWEQEKQKVAEVQRDAEQIEKQKLSLDSQMKQLELIWQQALGEREQFQAEIKAAELKPVASDSTLEKMRTELDQVRGIGKEWREAVKLDKEWLERQNLLSTKWQENQSLLQQKEHESEVLEKVKAAKQAAKEQVSAAWLEWQRQNMVSAIRNTLVIGEPCPVCGSEHLHQPSNIERDDQHEQVDEQHYKQLLERSDLALKEAEQIHHQAQQAVNAVRLERAELSGQERSLLLEKSSLDEKVANIIRELQSIGEGWQVADINDLLQRYQQAEMNLTRQLEERTQQKAYLEELTQKLTAKREEELERKAQYDKHQAVGGQLQGRMEELNVRLSEGQAHALQAATRLDELRHDVPVERIEVEYQRMEEQETHAESLRQQKQELEAEWKKLQVAVQAMQSKQTEKAIQQASLKERLQERSQVFSAKQDQLMHKTGGEKANVKLAQVEAKLDRLRNEAEAAEKKWKEATEWRQQTQEALVKTEENYLQLSRQYQEADLQVVRGLLETGLQDAAQVESFYMLRDQLTSLQERVQKFRTLQTQLTYDEQKITEKLGGREVLEEDWNQISHVWAELELSVQMIHDQLAVAKNTLSTIQANHEKWQVIYQDYQQITDEQSRLEDLRKLFEAKAFVQFIAEEKMAAIAKDASYHLRRMTKNRYSLEIGAEGEFILRDEASGGNKRPVSTLSGGETFLTSLALALALSVEIQMQGGRLEFFFLDEGFGTLDPVLLEVVLDALERLNMNDFTIGLISHVPELRVRMPRRLVITPAVPMGEGSKIHLEIE